MDGVCRVLRRRAGYSGCGGSKKRNPSKLMAEADPGPRSLAPNPAPFSFHHVTSFPLVPKAGVWGSTEEGSGRVASGWGFVRG